VKKAMFSR